MLRGLIFALTLAFLSAACRQDQGETLFEILYPPFDFTLMPGQPVFQSFVIAQAELDGGYATALEEQQRQYGRGGRSQWFFARITSLSGEDFGQLRSVDLRVCAVGQANGCDQFDVLFSVDDLYRRRDRVINLNPGLRNFKGLFEGGQLRLELVFDSGETTSRSIDCRLEWSVRGVRR
ncbi:MAG: hypothetical protein HC821_04535 [Lewinella sp.]|nr:hypothetical protein [Lewinella sp.]